VTEVFRKICSVIDLFDRAADELRGAEALLITAGAGIGVDSGLPDFRGNEGFWKAYPPMASLGISFSEMANPAWFERDPNLAWGFYGHRLNLYRNTTPHEGFTLLLKIARQMRGGYFVFTSNVDGQFQAAGFEGDRIEECHGSIHFLQCAVPCCSQIWEAETTSVEVDADTFRAQEPLPNCHHCGSLSRPNILMFSDWDWVEERNRIQSLKLRQWLQQVEREEQKLVVLEIGAGKAVPTVRFKSEHLSRSHEASLIRINPRDFEVAGPPHIGLQVASEVGIRMISSKL